MKNRDLFRFIQGCDAVAELQGVKFAYAIAKNRRAIIKEIEILQDAIKLTDEFKEYDGKRMAICKQYCEKDKEGEPIEDEGVYKIIDKMKFDEEIEILQDKYSKTIEIRKNNIDEYNKLLEDDSDLQLFTIAMENLPQDISASQLDGIYEMVKD